MTRGPPKKKFIKKVAGIDPNSRSDVNKSHVIISEKRDKKAAKYLVKDLPYPYTSKAQFDRRMEQPLGVEWNTRVGFQRGTLPKVVKKVRFAFSVIDANLLRLSGNVDGHYYRSTGKIILGLRGLMIVHVLS